MPIYARQLDLFLDGLPEPSLMTVYSRLVSLHTVRRVSLPGRIARSRVANTLLGHEVILGNWRKSCPDPVTAEYLRIFGSLGCRSIFVPYNPVETATLLPELEASRKELEDRLSLWIPAKSTKSRKTTLRRRVFFRLAERLESARPAFPVGGAAREE